MEDPIVPLERNLYGHPFSRDCHERGNLRKSFCSMDGRKFPNGACSSTAKRGYSLSVCVDDIKLAGKKQNLNPMWKVLNQEVDLGEPTSSLDHVYLGCTRKQHQVNKNIVDKHRTIHVRIQNFRKNN